MLRCVQSCGCLVCNVRCPAVGHACRPLASCRGGWRCCAAQGSTLLSKCKHSRRASDKQLNPCVMRVRSWAADSCWMAIRPAPCSERKRQRRASVCSAAARPVPYAMEGRSRTAGGCCGCSECKRQRRASVCSAAARPVPYAMEGRSRTAGGFWMAKRQGQGQQRRQRQEWRQEWRERRQQRGHRLR